VKQQQRSATPIAPSTVRILSIGRLGSSAWSALTASRASAAGCGARANNVIPVSGIWRSL